MRSRSSVRPRLELLETRITMSTGAATTLAASLSVKPEHGPAVLSVRSPSNSSAVELAQAKTIRLSGNASGTYTSTLANPDSGTQYHITARGTITPIGSAHVSGSFRTLGFINGGVETGTLTIVGPNGRLYLTLTETISPVAAGASSGQAGAINPGGPMIASSTQSSLNAPIVLVYTFHYHITRGTGQYTHDKGTGVIHITSTPGQANPVGPGIYNTATAGLTGSGRITLHFLPNASST
jgi:hypothetical protein